MKCKLYNTQCPFQTIKGCYYTLHGKTCAIQSGIDYTLYASQLKEMTSKEIDDAGGWCCDMRDLAIQNRSPISMYDINKIDRMAMDRMETGSYIRQGGKIIKAPFIAGLKMIED